MFTLDDPESCGVIYINNIPQDFTGKLRDYTLRDIHRDNGPAIIWLSGTLQWFWHGRKHRYDGPAVLQSDGFEEWLLYDHRHRDDGPALIIPGGRREWWRAGKLHRDDGPAIIYNNGDLEWWINDVRIPHEMHPFNIFLRENKLRLQDYEDLPTEYKVLWKLSQ